MMGRLLLILAFVANVLVLTLCTCTGQTTQASATSVSSASTSSSSSSSYASSSSSATTVCPSKPEKRRKVKKCPKNEEFSYCPESLQRPQYCSEKSEPSAYRRQSNKPCKAGCVCKENFLRADNRTCIPADQCPLKCGRNEVVDDCPHCVRDNCPRTEQDTYPTPCPPPPEECQPPICRCAPNYLRDANGNCIENWKCPPFDCSHRPNETFTAFPPTCRSDDCSDASPTGECPPEYGDMGTVGSYYNPKCICIEDYWRLDGICVPYEQCPGVCPTNETYSTCIQAECRALNCTQKDQPVPCIRMDPKYCEKGCVCLVGYLRNQFGICVLENECEPICPEDEEHAECVQGVCRAKYCYERGQDVPCPDYPPEECDSGCICKEGYLRAANGSCVPEDQCEANTCQRYEELSNCVQAVCRPLNCSDLLLEKPQYCPIVAEEDCMKGCVCQAGYLRDDYGNCVPEQQCYANKCSHNEQYYECANGICKPEYCTQKGMPIPCPPFRYEDCKPGCLCRENYLRNESGICIPEEECSTPDCPENAEWSTCAQAICRAQYCTERGKPIACPMILEGYCEKACVCKVGYLRNGTGDCIPEEQCPCPENEVRVDCLKNCNTEYCAQSADEEAVCYPTDLCVSGCECRFNYKRDSNGICIPIEQCPPFDCSDKGNETYVACPPYCPTDECYKPRLDGYCPYKIGVVLECKPQCQCKDGYGRVDGKCVLFEDCPNLCSEHEVYSSCVEQTCRPQNCADRDQAMETCRTCNADECHRGCVCEENYYRNQKGICVSYEECGEPLINCTGQYEHYECGSACQTECATLGQECPIVNVRCNDACYCDEGYARDSSGTCIPISEC